jgi:hypothetical protein
MPCFGPLAMAGHHWRTMGSITDRRRLDRLLCLLILGFQVHHHFCHLRTGLLTVYPRAILATCARNFLLFCDTLFCYRYATNHISPNAN